MTPPPQSPGPPSDVLGAVVETLDELQHALVLAGKALERARALAVTAQQGRPPAPRPMWGNQQRAFDPGPVTFGSPDPVDDNPDGFPPDVLAAYRGGGTRGGGDERGA